MSRRALSDSVYNAKWLERIEASVAISDSGCWLWTGVIHKHWGYGQTNYRGRNISVHRQMYKVTHGVTLRRDQYVCHTCDVRHCCNPKHLWLGSNSDNQKDSSQKGRHYESRRSECERGHEFTPENTKVRPTKSGGVARICKECERDKYSRNREAINARERERYAQRIGKYKDAR